MVNYEGKPPALSELNKARVSRGASLRWRICLSADRAGKKEKVCYFCIQRSLLLCGFDVIHLFSVVSV